MEIGLIIPAFVAGVLTFLAPCTLPLVPAYLSFISGVSGNDLRDAGSAQKARKKIVLNGFMYVLGFSLVFVVLGGIFGLGGAALSRYRGIVTRIGGVFVIFFGLYLMRVIRFRGLAVLDSEHRFAPGRYLRPGKPLSAFLFGATFAMGWSPCVGPILGSILLLASSSQTVWSGAFLLLVFSMGLGIPFVAIALGIGHASTRIRAVQRYMGAISIAGGVFLLFLGLLMVTGTMDTWMHVAYRYVNILDFDAVLDHL